MAKVKKQWEIPKKKMITLWNSDRQCYMQTGEIQPFICYQLSEKLQEKNLNRQLQKRKNKNMTSQVSQRRCRERTCDCGKGRVAFDTYVDLCAWWEPFHRCSAGRFHRLLFYCSERNHGDPSGTDEWNRDRGKTDI